MHAAPKLLLAVRWHTPRSDQMTEGVLRRPEEERRSSLETNLIFDLTAGRPRRGWHDRADSTRASLGRTIPSAGCRLSHHGTTERCRSIFSLRERETALAM